MFLWDYEVLGIGFIYKVHGRYLEAFEKKLKLNTGIS